MQFIREFTLRRTRANLKHFKLFLGINLINKGEKQYICNLPVKAKY